MASALPRMRLEELQALHSELLLAVVQGHGISAAMQLVGTSLQWLATLHEASSRGLPTVSRRVVEAAPALLRWKRAAKCALRLADPWFGSGIDRLPLECAHRRAWNGSRFKPDGVLLVRAEETPFAHGAMRECYRWRVSFGGGRAVNLVAKRYSPPSAEALEADVRLQARAKEYAAAFNLRWPPN